MTIAFDTKLTPGQKIAKAIIEGAFMVTEGVIDTAFIGFTSETVVFGVGIVLDAAFVGFTNYVAENAKESLYSQWGLNK